MGVKYKMKTFCTKHTIPSLNNFNTSTITMAAAEGHVPTLSSCFLVPTVKKGKFQGAVNFKGKNGTFVSLTVFINYL